MFVILVYDVNQKRVAKVLKIARKYLTWVQNSVLEGEISEANLKKLKKELAIPLHKSLVNPYFRRILAPRCRI
jgi:CRISPR-associated protein Cas2